MYPDLHITFLATKVFYPHLLADNAHYGTSEDVLRLRLVPLGQDGLEERDWAGQSETFISDLKVSLSQLSADTTGTDGFSRLPTLAVADVSGQSGNENIFNPFIGAVTLFNLSRDPHSCGCR